MADTSKIGIIAEAIAAALDADATVPELTSANIVVRKTNFLAIAEDIANAAAQCAGIAAVLYDRGGDCREPENSDGPVVANELALELFIDPLKHDITQAPSKRSADKIRESIMESLHNLLLSERTQAPYDRVLVTGYTPLDDPEFAAWRINLRRRVAF